jgi:eukaryotic-like serine/threonine-protein kinase
MSIADSWVLPAGLKITLVRDLPPALRDKVHGEDGDYAVSRPLSRTPSRILDANAVALLKEFRTPKTVVQAVIDHSRSIKTDPEKTLEESFPLLKRLIESQILVLPESEEAKEILSSLQPGARIRDSEIVRMRSGS